MGLLQGPILRTIQRFGKLGRRSGAASESGSEGVMKNAKYMFISIDEAGSHVGMRHFRWRLTIPLHKTRRVP